MPRLLSFAALCFAAAASPGAAANAAEAPVTFNHDIAPMVFENCLSCHRKGEVAPFPLTNYAEVKKKAETILSDAPATA